MRLRQPIRCPDKPTPAHAFRVGLLLALSLMMLTACGPAAGRETIIIPTRAVLPDGSDPELSGAERVARTYLDAWAAGDFAMMHSLITFSSQEAQPLPAFSALYEAVHAEMTLDSLTYRGITLARNGGVAIFTHDVTFTTRLVGSFTDEARALHLVIDERAGDWRVAWSRGDIFAAMADGGAVRLRPDVPNRANIYDSSGRFALASQNGRVVTINLIPDDIPDYDNCLNALSAALNDPVDVVQAFIEERPSFWLLDMGVIEPGIWEQTHALLEQYCAATFEGKSVRRYENGPALAHLIGYVGYPDEADIPAVEAAGFPQDAILGRSGIEASWDETLRGQPGGVLSIVNPSGEIVREVTRVPTGPSQSLWLTIDLDLQNALYTIIEQAYAESAWAAGSDGASIVVMEVDTGIIRAMVSYPAFENNVFTPFPEIEQERAAAMVAAVQDDPRRPQLNRPTLGAYPLGSVMKLVTASAITDSGVYDLDERYTCTGIWNRDITRYDWLAGGHGTLTVQGAITQSCNPFFYEAGYQLDTADPYLLPNYARRFGFGTPTGIADVQEAAGLIADPEWLRVNQGYDWRFSESVNIAIGQGFMQVTPLQVTRMVAAIANGGTLYQPQVVGRVGILGEEPSQVAEPIAQRQVEVGQDVLAMVRAGMCDVTITRQGTAEFVFRDSPLQRIGVCGKTGTAQSPGPGEPPHAWFVAYAPRDEPEIAVVVMVETAGEGSGVAAPIARQVLEAYFFPETRPAEETVSASN